MSHFEFGRNGEMDLTFCSGMENLPRYLAIILFER